MGSTLYRPPIEWDGGRDVRGREVLPIWPSIAKYVLRHTLDPDACWNYLFSKSQNVYRAPPLPAMLLKHDKLETFKVACRQVADSMPADFESQKRQCRTELILLQYDHGMSEKDSLLVVLLDSDILITPLFKYCLACSEQLHNVAIRYAPHALMQYIFFSDDYDRVWADWIPKKFRENARTAAAAAAALSERSW